MLDSRHAAELVHFIPTNCLAKNVLQENRQPPTPALKLPQKVFKIIKPPLQSSYLCGCKKL